MTSKGEFYNMTLGKKLSEFYLLTKQKSGVYYNLCLNMNMVLTPTSASEIKSSSHAASFLPNL